MSDQRRHAFGHAVGDATVKVVDQVGQRIGTHRVDPEGEVVEVLEGLGSADVTSGKQADGLHRRRFLSSTIT